MNTKKCVEKWKSGNFRVFTNRARAAKTCGKVEISAFPLIVPLWLRNVEISTFPLIVPLWLRNVEKWKSDGFAVAFPEIKVLKSLAQNKDLQFAEGFVAAWFDTVHVLPSVQYHTNRSTFDGLPFTRTKFDEIAGGKFGW